MTSSITTYISILLRTANQIIFYYAATILIGTKILGEYFFINSIFLLLTLTSEGGHCLKLINSAQNRTYYIKKEFHRQLGLKFLMYLIFILITIILTKTTDQDLYVYVLVLLSAILYQLFEHLCIYNRIIGKSAKEMIGSIIIFATTTSSLAAIYFENKTDLKSFVTYLFASRVITILIFGKNDLINAKWKPIYNWRAIIKRAKSDFKFSFDGYLVNSRNYLDILILGAFSSKSGIAAYQITMNTFKLLEIIPQTASLIMLQKKNSSHSGKTRYFILTGTLFIIGIITLTLIQNTKIIDIIFNEEVKCLSWIGLAFFLLRSTAIYYGTLLTMNSLQKKRNITGIIALALLILIGVPLADIGGEYGVALTQIIVTLFIIINFKQAGKSNG